MKSISKPMRSIKRELQLWKGPYGFTVLVKKGTNHAQLAGAYFAFQKNAKLIWSYPITRKQLQYALNLRP